MQHSYLLHVYLKAATSIVLLGHFFLTGPSVVVQALPLCIPFSGYVDNWVLVIDIISFLNYEMAFAQPIAKVGQRMANRCTNVMIPLLYGLADFKL